MWWCWWLETVDEFYPRWCVVFRSALCLLRICIPGIRWGYHGRIVIRWWFTCQAKNGLVTLEMIHQTLMRGSPEDFKAWATSPSWYQGGRKMITNEDVFPCSISFLWVNRLLRPLSGVWEMIDCTLNFPYQMHSS